MNLDIFCQHWKEPDCASRGKRWAQLSAECCWHRTCRQHPAKGKVWRASRERCKAQTCSQHAQQFFFSEKYICFNLDPGRVSRMFSLSLEPSQAHVVAGDTEWGAEEARHTHRTRVLEFKLHKRIQISRWHTWVRQQPANPNSQHRHLSCCHVEQDSQEHPTGLQQDAWPAPWQLKNPSNKPKSRESWHPKENT